MGKGPERSPTAEPDGLRSASSGPRSVFLDACAVLVLVLMVSVCAQVICSALDINPLVRFPTAWPLVGEAVTLNSLLDLQWHILAIIGLLPAGLVWRRNAHVRVDFLYAGRSEKARARIDLIGHLIFAGPFLVMATPAAWSFMMSAWRSDQGSPNGGLNDLWMIKAILPLGFAVLLLVLIVDCIVLFRRASRSE